MTLPSEIEIGLARGKLGDYLQEMVDAGWTLHIDNSGVRARKEEHESITVFLGRDDGWTGNVERDLAQLYVRWRGSDSGGGGA